MMLPLLFIVLLLGGGGLLYHFVPLETFNLFVPKDRNARKLAQDISYGPEPGQLLDVYAPVAGTGPWPVLVFVHGGSWSSGHKNAYGFLGRAIAAQGFLTAVISYRLHPTHRYPAFVEDTARALQWVSQHAARFGGTNQGIFALGHSAGAYNVAQAVLDKTYFQKLGADTSSIKGVATLAGPFDFLPLDSPISIDVFGSVEDLPATQPVNFARPDAPPFLILHGTSDKTCRPRNSINLDKALKAAGANSTLKLYDRVGHVAIMMAFAKPLRHLAPSLADVIAFFRAQP